MEIILVSFNSGSSELIALIVVRLLVLVNENITELTYEYTFSSSPTFMLSLSIRSTRPAKSAVSGRK